MTTDPQAESVRRLVEHFDRRARVEALAVTDPVSGASGSLGRFTHYTFVGREGSSPTRKPVEVQAVIDGDKLVVDIGTQEEVIVILNGKVLQEPVGATQTPAGATPEDIPARMRREAAHATAWADNVFKADLLEESQDVDGLIHNLRTFAGTLARGAAELEAAQRKAAAVVAPENWRWYVTVECDDDGGAALVAKDLQQSTGGRVRITEGPKGWQK